MIGKIRGQFGIEGSLFIPFASRFIVLSAPHADSPLSRLEDRLGNAVASLAGSRQSAVASLLQERLAPGAETDPEVRAALGRALDGVRDRLAWGERVGVVFTGASLGSIPRSWQG